MTKNIFKVLIERMDEREKISKYVQDFGSAASIGLLDPHCKIFQIPEIKGVIGYRSKFGSIVILGDPVCAKEDIPQLTQAFYDHFKKQKKNIIYAMASESFKEWAITNGCNARIAIGSEIILDPRIDILNGSAARLLRKKLNHSEGEGVTVNEYLSQNKELENEMEQVAKNWVKARSGIQVFLSHIDLFTNEWGKRWFYAMHRDQVVGVVLLNKIDAHNGWVLNLLMTTPEAPNGTSELLVMSVLETLKQEGYTYLTTGTVPGAELTEIEGLGSFSTWIGRNIYKLSKYFFNLSGRTLYWDKFQPQTKKSYLLFTSPKVTLSNTLAILNAFNVIP